ncbi:Membrane transport protein [Marinomonas gallaica]|uniref:Membrane transport protein n=1 Tax=Marinomonas gallaica TaxID=1806667 RepID=A0A1C3JUV3_9GAMM|nr:AEC family transporter [Marinomonas gallaica]SBT18917.1 Membrane transport protein [Marinomonas gallaica]SBT21872.1 Membrane transport protein [Marinomonas gallaica]
MMTAFITALTPVILLASLGFLLAKRTPYLDNPQLSSLVSNIGLPALLLTAVLKMNMDFGGMLSIVAATLSCLTGMAAVSYAFLKTVRLSTQFYLAPLVNPNTGNLGIPIAYALFGTEGLATAVVVSSVVQVSHFTLGVGFMSGDYQPKQLLKNGPVVALLLGLLSLGLGVSLPTPLMSTLEMLSAITLPIMLMLLGKSLANLNFSDSTKLYRTIGLACFRPIVGVLIASLIVPWFGFNSAQEATIISLQGMSVAVISYMLATKFAGPKDEIALMILISLPIALISTATVWWLYQ